MQTTQVNVTNLAKPDKKQWSVKSGVYMGVSLGAAAMLFNTDSYLNHPFKDSDTYVGFDWDVRLGFQHYFTPHQGFRVYASYGMGTVIESRYERFRDTTQPKGEYSYSFMQQKIDGNLDYLIDLIQGPHTSFGLFGGFYIGYSEWRQIASTPKGGVTNGIIGDLGFGLNLGVSLTLWRHSRIDIGIKLPILGIENVAGKYTGQLYQNASNSDSFGNTASGSQTNEISYRYTSVTATYSWVF